MGIKFANLASTTLASGVNATATSISVTSASSFPTLGSGDYFYASIGFGSDSEIVKVTDVNGATFTVVRGQDNTSASSHASGEEFALRVTAKALEDINESANQSITLSGDVSGSGTDTISVSVTNDSHTHAFNNLTGKEQGTGTYSTTGHIEAGRGSGGVALTMNDGYGNANVAFNHRSGTPEQTGNAGRIEVNTDRTNDADVYMSFEGKSGVTADTATGLNTMMELGVSEVRIPYKISHIGDLDTFIAMEANKVFIKTGGQTKWNSDNWTSDTVASAEFKFSGGLKTDMVACATAQQLVLNAGESEGKVIDGNGNSTQTDEYVYINAEKGLSVNTPDSSHSNWQAGYSVDTTIIKGTSITVDGNTVWHAGNDGSGSGLDADYFRGKGFSASGDRFDAIPLIGADGVMEVGQYIDFHLTDDSTDDNSTRLQSVNANTLEINGNKIWHAGNDGADSGLDADKLDGKHASDFPLVANGTVSSDFNDYTTAGNYLVSNWNPSGGTQISNGPTYTFNTSEVQNAYGWGMLRVSNFAANNDSYIAQEYVPHQDDGIWMRVYWGSTHGWSEWRQQYTNESDGNNDGLNADTLDGQEGSYYLDYDNFTNKPTIPSISGLATETYVDSAVSGLVDTAPDALNTLNELAAAINDDASFSSTINTAISAKLPKAGGTMTGNLAIELASPTITLKDTSDDDDHAIYFKGSSDQTISTIKSTTAASGSAEDALTFDSIRDIVFTRDNTNEKLRIDANGVDVTGNLKASGDVNGTAIKAEPNGASHPAFQVLNQAGTTYYTVIDGDRDIHCRNLDVDGTFTVSSGSSNSQSLTFNTGTAGSNPAVLQILSVLESSTAQGDVYGALHFGVFGAETSAGNLTDGIIAAVKAIDCRNGSTSYEDGGLGFYTTDHGDDDHKLRGYFGNSGGLHVTDDEGIEDDIPSGDIKADGVVTANGGVKIDGNLVITSGKVLQNVTGNAGIITAGAFGVDRIPSLAASKITSGTFGTDRIPSLAAGKITSGTFNADRIPSLAASKITSGTFSTDRIPTGINITGNASTASSWQTARTITLSGDASGSVSIDGSADATLQVAVGDDSHMHGHFSSEGLDSTDDLDSFITNGYFHWGSDLPTNAPNGYMCMIVHVDAGQPTQMAFGGTTPENSIYIRRRTGGVWSDWNRQFSDDYHPNADQWTTARNITVELTGDVTGSASASISGNSDKTISINTSGGGVVDSISNFANNRIITASDADSLNGEANLTFDGSTLDVTGSISTSSHGTSQNWYNAYVVSQNALSRSVTSTQYITGPVVHNGDVRINDGLIIEVTQSDYTPPLQVKRSGGTGATLATIETTGTYAAGLTFRTYYSSSTMHNQYYTGFYFGNGYISPTANAQGYLGDGTVNLGSSTFAWGNIYTQDCLYTQEEGAGFTAPRKAFSCRAWVSLNQTGVQAINKDQGISSISDEGVGKTRISFDSALPDTNYSVSGSTQVTNLSGDANNVCSFSTATRNASYVDVQTENLDGGFVDTPVLDIVVHR